MASTVWLASASGGAWGDEVELFTYTGDVIEEIDIAFDRDGRPVVVCERATGAGGSPEIWIYRYDAALLGYTFTMLDAGRTPRCILDAFPHTSLLCAPTPDVQVIYLKPGVGLVRRESKDDYAALYGSPLPYVPNIAIEEYFPTLSRRLSVSYSRRNRLTGEVELRRVDSLPYPDSLLLLPRFYPENSDDITFAQGEEFLGAPGQVDVEQLRVGVLEDVDAIEVQADTDDFSLTGWAEQNQTLDGAGAGYTAGASVQFPFTVTHGDGAMSPRAFRARTRKQVGAVTCYSAWAYWFAGHPTDVLNVTSLGIDDPTKVETIQIDADRFWVTYIPPGESAAVRELHFNTVTLAMQQIFDPGPSAWVTPYRVEVQGSELIGFDSTDGRYDFTLLSKIVITGGGEEDWLDIPAFDGNQSPGPFPPNPSPT